MKEVVRGRARGAAPIPSVSCEQPRSYGTPAPLRTLALSFGAACQSLGRILSDFRNSSILRSLVERQCRQRCKCALTHLQILLVAICADSPVTYRLSRGQRRAAAGKRVVNDSDSER